MKTSRDENEDFLNVLLGFMLLLAGVLGGTAIWEHVTKGSIIVLDKHEQKYEVIGIKPPKHFQLDLRNVDTGEISKSVYISKHCMKWKNLKIGAIVTLQEETYKYEKKPEVRKIINPDYKLCESL